ncbi:hypothetical protein [Amycolatopsis nalaikhensis]|uniref:Lipoprotein n=1 Tax=Amycolatopsis nalaikhensis TaxID=715472 RepID=A0ABY8XUX2_9PSEU|nr:hypothetical protein [Amycolatopsis sp. 2-2]WIV59230.1 hypothetical protein QP939_11665 [Amycolatopsis sp. 2-2]
MSSRIVFPCLVVLAGILALFFLMPGEAAACTFRYSEGATASSNCGGMATRYVIVSASVGAGGTIAWRMFSRLAGPRARLTSPADLTTLDRLLTAPFSRLGRVYKVDEASVCQLTMGAGPWAREGVALVKGNIDAPGVQELVNEAGNKYGCHTCGAAASGAANWVRDHQPPLGLAGPDAQYTAYPQCVPCMRQQGGTVRQLGTGHYDF